ncbi:MAG: PhzF family phenazine biosynthesis protein [Aeromicrobium sp.]
MRFSQVDVFTAELTLGNPVAVVHDADGVSDPHMAEFARWTNLSETTFLLTPTDPTADYRLRIFTPHGELPFAGHPTLGSARAWLAAGGVPRHAGRLVQQCAAGLVRVREDAGRLAFAAPPLVRGGPVDEVDVVRIATGLGLTRDDVVDARWADNGPGWVALLLADADAVLAVDPAALGADEKVGIVGPYADGSDADVEVRAFFTGGEDPVTGSLNAAIAQWLIGTGRAPGSYIASQGSALGRRGRVHVDTDGDDIWIGGDTVVGITGAVDL